jgi:GR25 family glycosyltransferase involved in LPS biosynthesis
MFLKKRVWIYWACILLTLIVLGTYLLTDYATPKHPYTFVINLDKRTDRMNEIKEEFRHWPVPIERISAIKQSPGWKGCSASHLKCIQLAKERNYPWVVILEDDCILTPNASQRFQELLPFLWKNRHGWDIFNGGVTHLKHHTRIAWNPSIYEVYAYAANFYMVHNSVYDRILRGHPKIIADFKIPIDVYYADTCRIWTITPYIARQRVGTKSDIDNRSGEDRDSIFDESEAMLVNYHK